MCAPCSLTSLHAAHVALALRADVPWACVGSEIAVAATTEALAQAEKHASRCETLAALVAEARTMLEQAAAVKAAAAAERLQMEEEAASLALRLQEV